MAVWFVVGMAVAVGVLVAMFRPETARWLLTSWQTYKEAIFLVFGVLTTYYALTSGVWYLMVAGAVGVVAAVWVLWFSDPFKPIMGWAR